LARTALDEGKYIQSFPEFGPERMGAPVAAFTRINIEPIRLHCAVYDPDVVVVLDNTLLKSVPVTSGLNENDNVLTAISLEEPSKFKKELTNSPKEVLHDRYKRIFFENFGHDDCQLIIDYYRNLHFKNKMWVNNQCK
jgi:pyruvate ferredoxin oxidoreductase gamma subunit